MRQNGIPSENPVNKRITCVFSDAGISRVGFCRFGELPPLFDCRARERLPKDAKSVAVCVFPYYCGEYPQRNVARYAICDDYHLAAGKLLEGVCADLSETFAGYTFVPFVDTSPIPEVKAARLAGLGVVGWHGLLIVPDYGAYVFIGCVVTTLELEPSSPGEGFCLECGACLKACPTGALSRNGFDRELCRSALTQKKGALNAWQAEQIQLGGMACGCDICLEACPMNHSVSPSPLKALCLNPVAVLTRENLEDTMAVKSYGYRGRAVLTRNLELIGG